MAEFSYPRASGHIGHVPEEESVCADCGTCELVCATHHEGACAPFLTRCWCYRDQMQSEYEVFTCLQCDIPLCMEACRVGAMFIDDKTGARCIDATKCNGCRLCMKACPYTPPRINYDPERKICIKCDLCKDRPEGPACVQYCVTECLTLVKKKGRK